MADDPKSGREEVEKPEQVCPKPWRATLDTDLEVFCCRTGIYPYEWGKGVINDVGSVMERLYDQGRAETVRELIAIPKSEYLDFGDFYGRRKKAEECWRTTNRILRRHGFRMYKKPPGTRY